MEVFRISKIDYADKLTSSGSENRWNFRGQNVIYAGASRSLSTLELIVHRSSIIPKIDYKVMVISIADDSHLIKEIKITDLPIDWRKMSAYSELQKIGSEWYENQETLALKVPSAVILNEYNYVINTEHPDFSDNNIKLVRLEDYFWDKRLI
jgi:RES domain-containing protein